MMNVRVDASELLKFTSYLGTIPKKSNAAVSRALNEVAGALARDVSEQLARQSGISVERVRGMIRIERATPERREVRVTMPKNLTGGKREREFPTRDREAFEEGELVNVVTMGDDRVCQICEDIAEGSPYPVDEAMAHDHHGGPIGTNQCRCHLEPFKMTRRKLTATASRESRPGQQVDVKFTLHQLAEQVKREWSLAMKAI